MNWNAISAIGTILAAFVGVAGIWLNIWDKYKKLNISFEMIPTAKVYISNNTQKTVAITKMLCSVNEHIFFVEPFDGLKEVYLQPATTKSIQLATQDIYESYFRYQMDSICNSDECIVILIYDNYGRKHKIKTSFPIAAFKK